MKYIDENVGLEDSGKYCLIVCSKDIKKEIDNELCKLSGIDGAIYKTYYFGGDSYKFVEVEGDKLHSLFIMEKDKWLQL